MTSRQLNSSQAPDSRSSAISTNSFTNLSVPRWDQPIIAHNVDGDGLTLSYTDTTEYTDGSFGQSEHYSEEIEDEGDHSRRRKKRKMAESVYSLDSRNLSQFLKGIHGRTYNVLNDAYILPSDELEWARLDKQHTALFIGMGGLTPCMDIVDRVLAPLPNERRQVLDVGCGTGIWAFEMARRYPNADVVGVDLAPIPIDPSRYPPNLRFEIDNINHGLTHFFEKFDLIHFRCVAGGINNLKKTMEDLQRCLKPGGLVIYIGGDNTVFSEDRLHGAKFPTSESDTDGSWTRKMLWEAFQAAALAGSVLTPAQKAELQDRGLWDHPLCDPETAVSGALYLPMGPWKKDTNAAHLQQLQYAGALIRQVFLNIHKAYHGILVKNGMCQKVLDAWSAKVDDELNTMRIKLWIRFRFCWARRRAGPGLPAPPLPTESSVSSPPSDTPTDGPSQYRYPFIEFYHSQEEAIAEMQRRNEAQGQYPECEVAKARERMMREKAEEESGTAVENA